METDCVVHNRKHLSKFHANINQLRRTNEFSISVLQQLPKRCCSCRNQTGESSFTVDHLRQLCHEIQQSQNMPTVISTRPKAIHHVILQCPSGLNPKQQIYKAGRFVGRNGQQLQDLERTLNISIHILNEKSSVSLRKSVDDIQAKSRRRQLDRLLVLFTMNNINDNDKENIEKIKQSLQETWNKIDITTKTRSKIIQSVDHETSVTSPVDPVSSPIEGDSRWKSKRRTPKTKLKIREKQMNEEEEDIPPQPSVKPLSMPHEITKSRKKK